MGGGIDDPVPSWPVLVGRADRIVRLRVACGLYLGDDARLESDAFQARRVVRLIEQAQAAGRGWTAAGLIGRIADDYLRNVGDVLTANPQRLNELRDRLTGDTDLESDLAKQLRPQDLIAWLERQVAEDPPDPRHHFIQWLRARRQAASGTV